MNAVDTKAVKSDKLNVKITEREDEMTGLSTLCYIEKDNKYLMLHRVVKKNDVNKDKWIGVGGHFEYAESPEECLLREVKEETGVSASIIKYIGKSHYNFTVPEDIVTKEVHWYLMTADNYHSRPQREEFFVDSGYYKFHEIYHLLRFSNEKQIVEKAYQEYLELRSQGLWGKQRRD